MKPLGADGGIAPAAEPAPVAPRASLVQLMCLYGYALSVFLPSAVLCAIPSDGLSWFVVGTAFFVSGGFLGANLWPQLKGVLPESMADLSESMAQAATKEAAARKKTAFLVVLFIVAAHAALSFVMKLLFFKHAVVAPAT